MEEKVVIMNSSEAKNLNENEYFTAYFNDVKYGMTDYYEDLDGNGAAEVVQRAEIMRRRRDTNPCVFFLLKKFQKTIDFYTPMEYTKIIKGTTKQKRKVETTMTRYGEEYKLDEEEMENIASYMNDEIREDLHFEIAPCEPEEFIRAYVERDPDFEELLNSEFSIEL